MKRRVAALTFALLTLVTLLPPAPSVGYAKEFTIEGIIDCGKPNGKICIPIDRKVGVLTESVSGKRERVIVDISWMLDKPVRRGGRGQLALEDNRAARGLLFTAFKDKIEAHFDAGVPTDSISSADARALIREAVSEFLETNADVIRHNLAFIVTNLRQDHPVTISVSDDHGPTLQVTTFHDRFDFMSDTSEGTLATGSLTGSDPDKDFCFDFVNEALDWAFDKLEKQGNLDLNDLEERFFDTMDDLPDPCIGYYDNVESIIADRATRTLQAKRTSLHQRIQAFLDRNPDLRRKLRAFLLVTILRKQGGGDERIREITERTRERAP